MDNYKAIICAVENGNRFLLLERGRPDKNGDVWDLPLFAPRREAYTTNLPIANAALRERFGFPACFTRYALHVSDDDETFNLYITDPTATRADVYTGEFCRWFAVDELFALCYQSPVVMAVIIGWLRDAGVIAENANLPPWWHEGWLRRTVSRLDACLAASGIRQTGCGEQAGSANTGAVLQAETTGGAVFYKIVASPYLQEMAVTRAVAARFPDVSPKVLYANAASGEMIMANIGGDSLGSPSPVLAWAETVHRYAVLQTETASETDSWLKLGAWDLRPITVEATLPSLTHRLMRAFRASPHPLMPEDGIRLQQLIPTLQTELVQWKNYGLPDCLEHGDLHVGNVRWLPEVNRPVFFDWGNACVTTPFFGLTSLCLNDDWFGVDKRAALARIEWAYLAPWAAYTPLETLAEAFVVWRQRLRRLFVLEGQLRTVEILQSLWRNANTDGETPCGTVLRDHECRLREAVRLLLKAHRDIK